VCGGRHDVNAIAVTCAFGALTNLIVAQLCRAGAPSNLPLTFVLVLVLMP
jgi:hypothetical protein